ncbi:MULTISPECIES: cytochrome o ubiquinol oxidase subunit IV [Paenibacillus]|jgi:cytochrome o ubiquinol oxidase operon protein cyoD|uniref:Cytochrome o ubiquinol oxidase subunit IV n=1 Tax=Paenibacillus baimaensis TaxID=2982185 RepID=A0ABT2U7R3_9BACL|nr:MULTISPECIES: cytochrome o ubiquinol oxidase subunit IV [Paenibacillus]MCU6790669.1 cytochrome o ubiquinol oxidase subunit IV [Paenibacillus sp. WQ 127069]
MDNHNAEPHQAHGGSLKSYTIGFILSIVLTIIPLVLVMNHMLNTTATLVIILLIAVLQFAIQMIFFMHIKEEQKPRYNLMALILGLVILVTIVSGSIWIMTYNAVAH